MAELSIRVENSDGLIFCSDSGEGSAAVVYRREYTEGDRIVISTSEYPIHLMIQVDECLGNALVYMAGPEAVYYIPRGEKSRSYSPKAFYGDIHILTVRKAYPSEINAYRNLALNVLDQHENSCLFPHASANVETRGEAVFAARNAIDGVKLNLSHGDWPYQSWGINRRDDAEFLLDFGRDVMIDKVVLITRADFPHDNWWRQVTITFSDNTSIVWDLEKSIHPHVIDFEKKKVSWLKLCNLIKADDPSPFPALTEIEVYGVEGDCDQIAPEE